MTRRMSSGSSPADSSVEPTRSQNMTVRYRRSAARSATFVVVGGAATLGASPSRCPHDSQNRLSTGLDRPQRGQGRGSGEPQPPQNSAPWLGVRPQTPQDAGSTV